MTHENKSSTLAASPLPCDNRQERRFAWETQTKIVRYHYKDRRREPDPQTTTSRHQTSSSLDPHPLRVLIRGRELLADGELESLDLESTEVEVDKRVIASKTSSSSLESGSDGSLEDVRESSGDDVESSTEESKEAESYSGVVSE